VGKNEYIKELEMKIKEYEKMLSEIGAPIIPSIIPNTYLVPLTGKLTQERMENIRWKVLNKVHQTDTDTVIIDFTGINAINIEEVLGYEQLANEIFQVSHSLKLMGIEPIYVGFSVNLTRKIVTSGIELQFNTYSTFKRALEYLMKKKQIRFEEIVSK
jgi:rsbT co-antagonist protein RsbR